METEKVIQGDGDCRSCDKYQHDMQDLHTITCVNSNIVLFHQTTSIKQQTTIRLQKNP